MVIFFSSPFIDLFTSLCQDVLFPTNRPRPTRDGPFRPGSTRKPPGPITGGPGFTTLAPEPTTPPRSRRGICQWAPQLCRNGNCISEGEYTYRCECYQGYENVGMHTCQGMPCFIQNYIEKQRKGKGWEREVIQQWRSACIVNTLIVS